MTAVLHYYHTITSVCMMENGTIVVDWSNDIVVDLDSWIEEVLHDDLLATMIKTGEETTTITPINLSQPIMSTVNGGTELGEGSSNALQSGTAHETMTVGSLTPGESTNTIMHYKEMTTVGSPTPSNTTYPMQNEGILSSAVKYISNIYAQTSQSQSNTDFPAYQVIPPAQGPQYQPLMQQDYKGKAVQQPTMTYPLVNQSNMIFGGLQNQLFYQMPSNQLLPCTGNMLNYIPTMNLQNSQALRLQMQNVNQSQIQLPQAMGSSSMLMSRRSQQGNIRGIDFSGPVGFASPRQFSSSAAFRQYALRQIRIMKDRYSNMLLRMHCNSMQLCSQEDSINYEELQFYLEEMMAFLNITRVEMLFEDDEATYNYMNMIVNYMSYHMNTPNGFSQLQPLGAMRMQNNTSSNISQSIASLEANVSNFNKILSSRRPVSNVNNNLSSRRPCQQQRQSRMPSSLNSGSYKAPQASVLRTTRQINPEPKTSNFIRPTPQISLLSNKTAKNFPFYPLNHQPPVVNQNLNLENIQVSMLSTNEPTESKAQKTSGSSSKQYSSGTSSLSNADGQQTKTPTDPPPQEPQTSEDQTSNLANLVKSVSPIALGSTLTEISSTEKGMVIIPNETTVNHEPLEKKRSELSQPSVYSNQFVSKGLDTSSTETPMNKKAKIESKWAILEEIKEINSKLVETSINVVMDASEDDIKTLAANDGTVVKCLFKNVACFPGFLGPQGCITSEKMPEFAILLLVPANYPASSPRIIKSNWNVLNEPWGMLYEEMLTKFDTSLCWIPGILSLGDIATNWDASARAVTTEFVQKRGAKSFKSRYGSANSGMDGSLASN